MKTFTFIVAFAFGILFLWSGIGKVKEPIAFAEAIRNFQLIGDPFAAVFAYFIPWVEVFAGIAVITDRFRKGGASILTASLVVFTGAIVISWMRGLDISCGCFGDDTPINYPVKVAQNLGLIATGIFLWWSAGKFAPAKSGE
jgi:putative oxidoreductase